MFSPLIDRHSHARPGLARHHLKHHTFASKGAMRPEDLDHDELLELDPDGGMIRFAGQRAVLLDAVAMGLGLFSDSRYGDHSMSRTPRGSGDAGFGTNRSAYGVPCSSAARRGSLGTE
jgi:hypothetical protein